MALNHEEIERINRDKELAYGDTPVFNAGEVRWLVDKIHELNEVNIELTNLNNECQLNHCN